jgi:K+:H+ antiporter
MTTLAVLLLAAGVGSGLAHRLRLPSIPFLILCGAVTEAIMHATAGSAPREFDILADVLLLGATFLVFSLGLRLDARLVQEHKKAVLLVSGSQFLILGGLGVLCAWLLNFGPKASLYLGVVTAASSTIVTVALLRERRQLFEPFGRLTAGVLLTQDLLVILCISMLHDSAGAMKLLILVVASLATRHWLSAILLTGSVPDEESRLILVLAFLFLFIGAADALGLPFIAGAFLAGLSLSGFPVNAVVRGQLRSIEDFFIAAFFTALGASLLGVSLEQLPAALTFVLLLLVVTPLVVTWAGEYSGLTSRGSLESGLLLSQASEFSLVTALMGVAAGELDQATLGLVVLITVLSMLATPFLATDQMTWWLLGRRRLRREDLPQSTSDPPVGHVVLIGAGEIGLYLLNILERDGRPVVVIEGDPVRAQSLKERGIAVVCRDGADPHSLSLAGATRASLVVSTLARPEDTQRLLRHLDGCRVLVRVDNPAEADIARELGGEPVGFIDLAIDEFGSIPLLKMSGPATR